MDDLVLMQIRKAAADASLVGILHPAFPSPPFSRRRVFTQLKWKKQKV